MNRRLSEAQQQFEGELASRLASKDEECQKTLHEKMNEHVVAVEAEKARALKLEASKWKQALKEAEKRVALEVAQGRLDGRYEREQELRFELVDLAERNQQALLVVQEKHKKAAFDAEAVAQQQLAELKEAMLVQQQQAVAEAERALRARNGNRPFLTRHTPHPRSTHHTLVPHTTSSSHAYIIYIDSNKVYHKTALHTLYHLLTYPLTHYLLEREWAVTLKEKIDSAVAQAQSDSLLQLNEQKQAFDALRSSSVEDLHRLHGEMDQVKMKLAASEDVIKRVEFTAAMEKDRLERTVERERENVMKAAEELTAQAVEETTVQLKAEFAETIDRNEEIFKQALMQQKQKDQETFTERLDNVTKDGLLQVTKLEGEIDVMIRDKARVDEELVAAKRALSKAEVDILEQDRITKEKFKEFSFTAWKMTASMKQVQSMFDQHAREEITKCETEQATLREHLQKGYNATALALMRVSNIILQYEEIRRRTDETLRSYRVDDLNQKKRGLKVLEEEIQQLDVQKETFEEQRDDVEEEIELLEEQVKTLEDELRQHNSLPSTSNGRIDVAHARKKRRLDSELERLLETIEQKRSVVVELQECVAGVDRERDEREGNMVTLEKELVGILVEQQKLVLNYTDKLSGSLQRAKELIVQDASMPWPPPDKPTEDYIVSFMAKQAKLAKISPAALVRGASVAVVQSDSR